MNINSQNISESLSKLIKSDDIRNYAKNGVMDLIQAIFKGDVFQGLSAIKNFNDLIFNIPSILFWEKMQKFLLNTFGDYDFEDQIKMIGKFEKSYCEYSEFVKTQMHIIDKINDDKKIEYCAKLTRSLLLNNIDLTSYYKLIQIMDTCTVDELEFLKSNKLERIEYNIRIYFLSTLGLVKQEQEDADIYFVLTPLAKVLREYGLSDNLKNISIKYTDIDPPALSRAMTNTEIDEMINNVKQNSYSNFKN